MRKITKIETTIPYIPTKKRVAAYARVSMESERLMHSLSAQVSYYNELTQSHHDWEYVGVYADDGISGTTTHKRDEFKRLIADCEDGKIDIILTKSISRFARNTVDLLNTVHYLKGLGISVQFEKEKIDSLTENGELMLTLLASFAQEESYSISDNVKWGTRKRFEQGIPNGKVHIYGYQWKNSHLEIVPYEAEIVKRIYNEYLTGNTPRTIASRLNSENVTTINGCKWCDFNIRYLLKNITYTGNLLLQKTFVYDPISKKRKQNTGELPQYLIENNHAPIIDRNMFDKVQNEFTNRSNRRKSIFSPKLKCGICGERYIRNTYGKPAYKVWVCKTKKNCGCNVCNGINIREDILKKILAEVLGINEFDDKIFDTQINTVIINDNIQFIFYDGNTVIKKWREI